MSDDKLLPPEDRDPDDLLAAEYVLGLLDGPDWRATRDRALVDAAFAARVQDWEARLAPLNAEFPEAAPPDVLGRVEARLFATPKPRRFGWGWGLATGSVLALALLAAVAVLTPQAPRVPGLQAELVDESGALVLAVVYDRSATRLNVTTTGPEPGEGQDYELWVIDDSGVLRSLGLLVGAATEIIAELELGQTLAVSLEPAGGSPEPVPTGPVLAAAPLTEA
ncbi:MAG: anti-sigma factor domain-containing protein [Roseinatronobacter sp.]